MVIGIAVWRRALDAVIVFLADVELAANDWLDSRGFGGIHKMHRAKNIAVVGHGHGRHAQLLHVLAKLLDVTSAVEHRVVSMKMKVNELRHSDWIDFTAVVAEEEARLGSRYSQGRIGSCTPGRPRPGRMPALGSTVRTKLNRGRPLSASDNGIIFCAVRRAGRRTTYATWFGVYCAAFFAP